MTTAAIDRLIDDQLQYEIHMLEVELDVADARHKHLDWTLRGFPAPWRRA